MAALRRPSPAASSSADAAFSLPKGVENGSDRFPAGLRVLVVDDDTTCLKILEQMLRKCEYKVTVCSRATSALSLLRERKGHFDLVISDVHMPDMDGLKLLELVGLEMELPVIMMSADSRTSMVMKGIKHGACDYLIKPVRFEELRNVWQHIVRKKWNDNKDYEQSGGVENSERLKNGADDIQYASPTNDVTDGNWTAQKKKRDAKEDQDESELENDDASISKKPRVVWSVELHQQFVCAVNQLGIDKAVPKRILELMNVPGLTRENVASHLQKYRLYLKRISGVAQFHGGLTSLFPGAVEANPRAIQIGSLNFQSLVSSGQIPPQTLAALNAELLGRTSSSVGDLPSLDQPVHRASLPSSKCIPSGGSMFGLPLIMCQSGMTRRFPEINVAVHDIPSGFGTWKPSHAVTMGNANVNGLLHSQNGDRLIQMSQQQQSTLPLLAESSSTNNMQPSYLVTTSQSSTSSPLGNSSMPISPSMHLFPTQASHINQAENVSLDRHSSNNNIVVGEDSIYSQLSNTPLGMGRVVDGDHENAMPSGFIEASVSSVLPSCSMPSDVSATWKEATSDLGMNSATLLSSFVPALGEVQSSGSKHPLPPFQGQRNNLGFVGKGTCIPSRFAVDDIELPADNLNQRNPSTLDEVSKVKQEIYLDFKEGSIVGNPVPVTFK